MLSNYPAFVTAPVINDIFINESVLFGKNMKFEKNITLKSLKSMRDAAHNKTDEQHRDTIDYLFRQAHIVYTHINRYTRAIDTVLITSVFKLLGVHNAYEISTNISTVTECLANTYSAGESLLIKGHYESCLCFLVLNI